MKMKPLKVLAKKQWNFINLKNQSREFCKTYQAGEPYRQNMQVIDLQQFV
jgi:hypothetical protein